MNLVITIISTLIVGIIGVVWWGRSEQRPEPVERICAPHYDTLCTQANTIISESIDRIDPAMRDMCRYAVNDGRRVRAVIVLAIAGDNDMSRACTSAVEYVHAASLIVDDIMDRDTFRRGKPTVAAAFGQDSAQMASVQLVSSAFLEIYTAIERSRSDPDIDRCGIDIMGQVATTLRDLSLGQYSEQHRATASDDIIRQKTGSLFEMAFVCGWYARRGDIAHLPHVRETARQFGELFQIVDDIGDVDRDASRGITSNYVLAHGLDRAQLRCGELASSVIDQCREMDIDTRAISEITAHLVSKSIQKK